ncbi:MAG: hypothetical protein ABFD08_08360 [Syntrophomonas sp.]
MGNKTEKKGLLGFLKGNKKESNNCCCNFRIEEIPEEDAKAKEAKDSPKSSNPGCCDK